MQEQSKAAGFEVAALEKRAAELRAAISDLGHEIDSMKARKAAAAGGGVFLLLLAAIAAYDHFTGHAGLWLNVGISDSQLTLLAAVFGIIALVALVYAVVLERRRDRARDRQLEAFMQELEDLLARKAGLES